MRYRQIEYCKRQKNTLNNCKKLNIEDIVLENPTLIVLGGNGDITLRQANGLCKIAERMMGVNGLEENSNFQIIGVSYGQKTKEIEEAQLSYEEDIAPMVRKLLLPLCYDEKGKVLDVQAMAKRFSNINFFTYCYGAKVLHNMLCVLISEWKNMGISVGDMMKVLSCMSHVSYAPLTDSVLVPTVRAYSGQDETISTKKMFERLYAGRGMNGLEIMLEEVSPKEQRFSEAIDVLSSGFDFQGMWGDHHVKVIDRTTKWRSITDNENADMTSMLLSYAMSLFMAESLQAKVAGESCGRNMYNLYRELVAIKENTPEML
ncbi:MAG: hypothetical protein IJW59_00290 [Clostridia bacterium]|nr:hypothetical protein [Clostridia bacterium]